MSVRPPATTVRVPTLVIAVALLATACGGRSVQSTPEQLRRWGYRTASVPSVDDRMADCQRRFGRAQLECWTTLDQYMMQNVVPWIPFLAENYIQVVPARIVHYSFDQAAIGPAFEQIALKR